MPDNLDQLLAARRDLDRAIAQHTRDVAVMFTDIVGSTQYFERAGDVEGLSLVKRHNAALFPVVERHGGRVVKTIGDAIMAVFEDPPAGIRCALDLQRTLATLNAAPSGEEPIHIRIGVHAGKVMLDGGDVFGDTVNTASRVAHEAQGDEVLISASLAALAPPSDTLRVVSRGTLSLKGKAEPFPVVRALWRDGDEGQPGTPLPAIAAPPRAAEVFVLEIGVGATGLRVAVVDGDADKGTVRSYQEVPLTPAELEAVAAPLGALARGSSATYVEQLRQVGQELVKRSLSERAREHLASTQLGYLRLQLDERLVHLPWELLHDGRDFLGLRFAVGRWVTARDPVEPPPRRTPHAKLERAVVVGDPCGDLPSARREGQAVAGLLRERLGTRVELLEGRVTRAAFLAALGRADLFHFAGHARAGEPAGFMLADGIASPVEVRAALGEAPPLVVFANGCHASTSTAWEDAARGWYTLGSALLLGGVQHYLGPLWEVPDADALAYALRFYEGALEGLPLGEAARTARHSLLQPPARPTSFAGYVLYGEPRTVLPLERARITPGVSLRSSGEVRAPSNPGTAPALPPPPLSRGAPETKPSSKRPWAILGAGAAVMAIGVGSALWRRAATRTSPTAVAAAPVDPLRHTGPLRLSVLPFKNASGDAQLNHLSAALQEAMVTDLGGLPDTRLIERGQLDLDIHELEFSQSGYVDPATRAALGKITGAEVVVMGAYQQAGDAIRVSARLVDAESGEILGAVKVDRPRTQLFDLQDAVTAELRKSIGPARTRLRP